MDNSLLQQPIPETSLSESFKRMAYRHHFRTLQDVLHWPVNVLLMHEGFTQHHFQELRNYLIQKDGIHLLKTSNPEKA